MCASKCVFVFMSVVLSKLYRLWKLISYKDNQPNLNLKFLNISVNGA